MACPSREAIFSSRAARFTQGRDGFRGALKGRATKRRAGRVEKHQLGVAAANRVTTRRKAQVSLPTVLPFFVRGITSTD